jgi:N-acetylglutamate synthase-like GNAT family acetyltransferase
VRGQKLFVRPIENGDSDSIRAFLKSHGGRINETGCGLLGKLVGELVAVVAMEIEPDAVRIDDVVVATDLRRKRIGRFMLDEVERLASKLDRKRVVVSGRAAEREFFHRTGFKEEGEWLVRIVH